MTQLTSVVAIFSKSLVELPFGSAKFFEMAVRMSMYIATLLLLL
jgi:hypothetical protein